MICEPLVTELSKGCSGRIKIILTVTLFFPRRILAVEHQAARIVTRKSGCGEADIGVTSKAQGLFLTTIAYARFGFNF